MCTVAPRSATMHSLPAAAVASVASASVAAPTSVDADAVYDAKKLAAAALLSMVTALQTAGNPTAPPTNVTRC